MIKIEKKIVGYAVTNRKQKRKQEKREFKREGGRGSRRSHPHAREA